MKYSVSKSQLHVQNLTSTCTTHVLALLSHQMASSPQSKHASLGLLLQKGSDYQ
jgi:hypothetical protein